MLLPPELAGTLVDLRAAEARYIPPGKESPSGGWLLTEVTPSDMGSVPGILQELGSGKYFLYSTLSFDDMSRSQHWYQFAGTRDLLVESDAVFVQVPRARRAELDEIYRDLR